MKNILVLAILTLCFSCQKENNCLTNEFNSELWKATDGNSYPNRECMYENLVESQFLKSKNKNEITLILSAPDREENGHLFYMISQEKAGFMPLHTTTLVIKLNEDETVNWVKIHK